MAFNRGDVVLIPFPYTDLSAAKTLVQSIAEKSVAAIVSFDASHTPGANVERLKELLGG